MSMVINGTSGITFPDGSLQGIGVGRRNLIINGAMQVAQRGTSVAGITGAGYFTCDRWDWYSNCEDTITQSQSTDAPDGFSNSLKIEVTTAETTVLSSENARIQYGIEGQDLQHLAYGTSSAKPLTISFWVKSSVTGNYSCSIQHIDASQYYSDVYTINSANTWEYKTITVPGYTSTAIANDNTEGMRINFGLTSGTDYTSGSTQTWGDGTRLHAGLAVDVVSTLNATWQITGVQLEVGSVATPFEHRSYGEELALCMRYYELLYTMDGCHAGSFGAWAHENRQCVPHYKVRKRATPTITFVNYTTNISGTPWVTRDFQTTATQDCFKFNARFFGTNEYIYIDDSNGSITADAEL